MVLVTWTQGPWIAKYLERHCCRSWVPPVLRSELRVRTVYGKKLLVPGQLSWSTVDDEWSTVTAWYLILECQCLMLHLESMPARGRSASSYEAADKKKSHFLSIVAWSSRVNRAHRDRVRLHSISISVKSRNNMMIFAVAAAAATFAIIAKVILSKPEYKDLTKLIHSHADTGMIASTGKINQESMKDFGTDAGSKWVPTKRWTYLDFHFQINFETKNRSFIFPGPWYGGVANHSSH